ncbi:MAG TPA: choice-of-anchor Q domain-containing protein [Myxococcota bacterium]|nr:choice-of-anchor Q domain-containing protein [Myxococcota bacterium]
MRWSPCALLLLLAPSSLAFAAPKVAFTLPDPNNPVVTSPLVTGTVSGATGTPTVTVTVSGDPNNPVPATVTLTDPNNGDFTFSAKPLPFALGPQTLTATETDGTGPGTDTATLDLDVPFVIVVSAPTTPTVTTGRTGVRFTGQVQGESAFDQDPNNISFALRGLVTPLDANGGFDQFVKIGPGPSTVFVQASDPNSPISHSWLTTYSVTRTVVCDDSPNEPGFPVPISPDATKLGSAFFYSVDRPDDLPNSDPNSIDCEVRADSNPPPTFTPPIPHCTLRAAIQASNAHHAQALAAATPAPGDQIFLGGRHIALRRRGAHEDQSATGDLDVRGDLRIIGNARDASVIDGRGLGDRVLDVGPGVHLELFDLTVTGGQAPAAPDPNQPLPGAGGCLRDQGDLLANNTAFLGCSASTDGGAILEDTGVAKLTCSIVARSKAKADGGGILAVNGAKLELRNSTLSLNSAGGRGGAVAQRSIASPQPSFTLTNGTLTGNSAKLSGGALELGGGNQAALNNCTFSGNRAKSGSTLAGSAEVLLANSILGDLGKSACDPNSPLPTSGGGNIERGDSCLKSNDPDDLVNTDPKLTGISGNSAAPPTQKLLTTSPAIDFAGSATACTELDARDTERLDWPGLGLTDPNALAAKKSPFCDAGSFELLPPGVQPQ